MTEVMTATDLQELAEHGAAELELRPGDGRRRQHVGIVRRAVELVAVAAVARPRVRGLAAARLLGREHAVADR